HRNHHVQKRAAPPRSCWQNTSRANVRRNGFTVSDAGASPRQAQRAGERSFRRRNHRPSQERFCRRGGAADPRQREQLVGNLDRKRIGDGLACSSIAPDIPGTTTAPFALTGREIITMSNGTIASYTATSTLTATPTRVPEPGSVLLLGTGMLLLVGHLRRRG